MTPVSAVAGQVGHHARRARHGDKPHPLQAAFIERAGAAMRLLHQRHDHERGGPARDATQKPTESEVRTALDGNLCRCGTHVRVVRAVMRAGAGRLT